jgi:translation initiation factor 3 subunit M
VTTSQRQAHLLNLWPIDSPETEKYVTDLLPIVTSATAESTIKYCVCVSASLRCLVTYPPKLDELLQHASTTICPSSPGLQHAPRPRQHKRRAARAARHPHRLKWLKEWEITPSEKSAFLKRLVDAFSKAGQRYVLCPLSADAPCRDTAYHYKLAHVRSLDPSHPTSQATQLVALDAIATALSDNVDQDHDNLNTTNNLNSAKTTATTNDCEGGNHKSLTYRLQ